MLRRRALTALALMTFGLVQGCGNQGLMTSPYTHAISAIGSGASAASHYTDRVVVKFRTGVGQSQMRAFQQQYSLTSIRTVSSLNMGVMAVPAGKNANQVLSAIAGHPDIAYAEPDYVFSLPPVRRRAATQARSNPVYAPRFTLATGIVNDPLYSQQWGLKKIQADKIWPVDAGSPSVTVAVVDTGVDLTHPDLIRNLVPGYSVLPNYPGPSDDHGHGTHCAGIIAAAANDDIGGCGVAPNCKIMPVKVLDHTGNGATDDIVAGIEWAVNNGAKVLSLSLGGVGGSRALEDAIQYAESKDVVICAAMGNDGSNEQEYPAGYAGVIAVGASDENDQICSFSDFGSWCTVAAPGQDILSTLPTYNFYMETDEGKNQGYDNLDGTSMATPFVAGVAALIRSRNPHLTAPQVKAIIQQSADQVGDSDHFGAGRLNAYKAVMMTPAL